MLNTFEGVLAGCYAVASELLCYKVLYLLAFSKVLIGGC